MTFAHAVVTVQAIDAVLYHEVDGEVVIRKMPFKVRYKLSKIKDVLQKEVDAYEGEREKLVKELGGESTDEQGNTVFKVKDENMEEFMERIREVLSTDIEVTYPRLEEEDLNAIGDTEIEISEEHMQAFVSYVM